MKILKMLVLMMLMISQSAYSQTAELNTNKEASTIETISKTAEKTTLTLSIPMMGNIRVHQASKQLREATGPLHTEEHYSHLELVSHTDKKEEQDTDTCIDYPGDNNK